MIPKSARTIARTHFPTLTTYWRRLRLWRRLAGRDPGDIFAEIHRKNAWADTESASGPGSRLDRTTSVRTGLPQLVHEYQWRTLLDIPCGDFNWMKDTPLDLEYVGADIVDELIARNQERYGRAGRAFRRLDLTRDDLPRVDAILCRDCFVHLSFAHIRAALRSIKASRSTYLLATTFTQREENRSILTGEWRPTNLQRPPFGFPPPLTLMDDSAASPNYYDKHLGLWRCEDLPDF